jgi:integrase
MVPAFVESLPEAEAGEATKLAFEFLILTAARTSEVLGARWEEIDRAEQTWTIPTERIKAGREHRVPLSPRCIELLDRAEAIADGGPYVFPGRPSKSLSNMVFLMLLRWLKRHDITAHGFRSAFRDWAAERTSFARAVCEGALAHVVRNRTEAAYFRSDLLDLRRQLMESWARFVTSVQAKVVSINA